ncbi:MULTISPECIES: 50S ribosomal protein L25/general stress protein Ctc [Vitreoscilla]|uniref:Large ribosomal subunit protein bL25 n=1 Tax=Vitreoscilla stercoraria TaxID=61 RepID=A0ABY4EH23_VITST|nr:MULTISPECIES: 50S ribosomal protein L25/general stress protein Ctc [Vitreoscilla]AUZ05931.1 50S ribosomal protein L25 [Vitreoscilla sp. C1]UOO92697.1 50S ribosomal protein L25/general stress protein Ctc [Vitreoscilla stercoraria]
MSQSIQAIVRDVQGTGASRRLRRAGQVPAVVYGENQEATMVAIDGTAIFYALQKESFHSSLLKLSLDGKEVDVIVRDFQMHPFKPAVLHVDFQAVDAAKVIKVKVPVHYINAEQSPAVKLQGGRVSRLIQAIEVYAPAANIPAQLTVDLKAATAGQIVHISDIVFPEGVESVSLKRDENLAIAAITGKKR